MIQETSRQIGEMRMRCISEREAREARRERLRYIDELINQFELLNLADEAGVPAGLLTKVARLVATESHPIAQRPVDEVSILEWMDALYELQDAHMIVIEDDIE